MKQLSRRVEVVMTAKQQINHDCYIFSFEYIHDRLDFSIGQCLKIHATVPTHDYPQGEHLKRKYTPINPCSQKNRIDLLVKIYRPNDHELYPYGGKFTPYLEAQQVGARMIFEGPSGKFHYQPIGRVFLKGKQHHCKRLLMIAGGSGITPLFQTMMEIANRQDDKTKIILLFANKTEQDIVLRKELEGQGGRIKVHYMLSRPHENWKGYRGHISHFILKEICPQLQDLGTMTLMCGPKPMIKFIFSIYNEHYPKSTIFKF